MQSMVIQRQQYFIVFYLGTLILRSIQQFILFIVPTQVETVQNSQMMTTPERATIKYNQPKLTKQHFSINSLTLVSLAEQESLPPTKQQLSIASKFKKIENKLTSRGHSRYHSYHNTTYQQYLFHRPKKCEILVINSPRNNRKQVVQISGGSFTELEQSLVSNTKIRPDPFINRSKKLQRKAILLANEKKKLHINNFKANDKKHTLLLKKDPNGKKVNNVKVSLDLSQVNISNLLKTHHQQTKNNSLLKRIYDKKHLATLPINYNRCCQYFEIQSNNKKPLDQQNYIDKIQNSEAIAKNNPRYFIKTPKSYRTTIDQCFNMKNPKYQTLQPKPIRYYQTHRSKNPKSNTTDNQNNPKRSSVIFEKCSPWQTDSRNPGEDQILQKYQF